MCSAWDPDRVRTGHKDVWDAILRRRNEWYNTVDIFQDHDRSKNNTKGKAIWRWTLSGAASSELPELRGSANVKLCIIKHMVHASAPPTGFSRTGSLQEAEIQGTAS